jgi:hypothetical protein
MSDDKRVRADVCPICHGAVLAPERVRGHIRGEHPEVVLPDGQTVDEALARLDAERATDPWHAGWNAALRWLEREPLAAAPVTDAGLRAALDLHWKTTIGHYCDGTCAQQIALFLSRQAEKETA